MALLKITDASGRSWQFTLDPQAVCTIGRATDNSVVLDDPRVSRYHAHIRHQNGQFVAVDGWFFNGQLKRSANKVYVNNQACLEYPLETGDRITIGSSSLDFELAAPVAQPAAVDYDDKPLGQTQVFVSASELLGTVLKAAPSSAGAKDEAEREKELQTLQRKASILSEMYEMSKVLGGGFDLDAVFAKATDIIFRMTEADRVVALLADGADAETGEPKLNPVASRTRDPKLEEMARKMTIGRTITRTVMRDRVALLSQDIAADERFNRAASVVSQGVRSTICAPLVTESGVHGALYADRLDQFSMFKPDDLELVTAVAAQAAIAVENTKAHERLAREEVARANYGRFMPEWVVKQMLENPESFKLGGVNQIVTVLFADIRGFTRLSEHALPEKVVQLLNRYFSEMTEIIFHHGGTLDKYIGDGLMALFGAPTVTPNDANNAINAAVDMQRAIGGINADLRAEGLPEVAVGIGLHTGVATVGYIGSEKRSEYTAIGDTVNLAARLESNCQGGRILISDATSNAAQASQERFVLTPRDPITVKNRTQPVPLFEVEWAEGET
jgi:adenylate cyclase